MQALYDRTACFQHANDYVLSATVILDSPQNEISCYVFGDTEKTGDFVWGRH